MAYEVHNQLHGHICGCYVIQPRQSSFQQERLYLPQINLKSHVTLHATVYSALLTQTYLNPTSEKLKEIRYTFPLYDGVSVVEFTCETASRFIKGEVKQRDIAKIKFKKAVARGQTASLLEQLPEASDVFTTTIGNIEGNGYIKIQIRYVGELKHDAEVDGLRLTIPTTIAPRYGDYPGEIMNHVVSKNGMQFVVDAHMSSPIHNIQSPTHPISVSIGTLSSDPNADPMLTKASASLTRGSAELDHDIVIQIISKGIGSPRAMLESHPTIPGHRAIAATLVPNFSLSTARPEVIFVADRSGSMESNIPTLKSALQLAIKSLPVGTRFNICSFGSSFSFLWPKSKLYSETSVDEASRHVKKFAADYGGTEMFTALRAALENRNNEMHTEVLLLTDGEIRNQREIVSYVNAQVRQTNSAIRIFTLGIGDEVSHSLIGGIARAGNGFSQAVGNEEKLDRKIIRMMRGALTCHTSDYSVEIKCQPSTGLESHPTEKISATPQVYIKEKISTDGRGKAPIPLFSRENEKNKADDTVATEPTEDEKDRYEHLPEISLPQILQVPHSIPPLFPFNRTNVYLLLSPENAHLNPVSITLRAMSPDGPLELEIPIDSLGQPSETMHQLAAKKAIQELEEGNGWLTDAIDQNGKQVKDAYPNLIEEIVEREAVRLGVTFQVGGKWCSFVAVTKEDDETTTTETALEDDDYDMIESPTPSYRMSESSDADTAFAVPEAMSVDFCTQPPPVIPKRRVHAIRIGGNMQAMSSNKISGMSTPQGRAPRTRGHASQAAKPSTHGEKEEDGQNSLLMHFVATQKFEGFWPRDSLHTSPMHIDKAAFQDALQKLVVGTNLPGPEKDRLEEALATAIVVLYLERKMSDEADTWELMVLKAKECLDNFFDKTLVKTIFEAAQSFVGSG